MKSKQPVFPPRIETKEQAINWIEEIMLAAEEQRRSIDVMSMNPEARAVDVRSLYDRLLMVHGSVSGMTAMAYAVGHIDNEAFLALSKRAIALIADRTSLWTPR